MTVTAEDQLVFENEEWLVTGSGLEHKGTGYFIDRESLGSRRSDGLWSWPLHMAEKQWCSLAPFTEAFTCAAALHGARVDADLARSFKAARCEIVGWPNGVPQASRAAQIRVPPALRREVLDPISREPLGAEESAWDRVSSEAASAIHFASQANRERSSTSAGRSRPRGGSTRAIGSWRWRAPPPFRRASTRLVRLLQAAFSGS